MIREVNYNEIFDAQAHFRIILDSMARPGKVNNFGEIRINAPGEFNPASALVAFALLNRDVTFFSATSAKEFNEYMVVNTHAVPSEIQKADFVFINGAGNGDLLLETNVGILEYPEKSATIIIDVENIYDVPKDQTFEIILRGPGVETEKRVYVRNISLSVLQALKEQNAEFPLGVDVILTDKEGNILCIPRSNNFSWN
ncbi:MAG: phosphonate C-P lyase system protein PhnH [Bacteroidales bacterium]|nr:phosphonate C-P lyase system protein PhnH [Bacteroidales bacterium]